jgi:hypothetical protein
MTLQSVIEGTQNFINLIGDSIDDVDFEWSNKNIAAAGCLHIALEHHGAIALLVKESHKGSAAALVRPLFESVLRGSWLYECATDEQAESFLNDKIPDLGAIVKDLETKPFFKEMKIANLKKRIWGGLCSYTHSGGLHVTRRVSSSEVTQNYSDEEIVEMLMLSNMIALMGSYELCLMLDKIDTANLIWASYKEIPQSS